MDKKESYQYYLEEARKLGYKMSWYDMLVGFILILWMIIRSLALVLGLIALVFNFSLDGIIILLVTFVELFLIFKIRQAMMAFSKNIFPLLWVYLALTALSVLLGIIVLALMGAAMADISVGFDIVLPILFVGLNAIYFYKRRGLFGTMPPPAIDAAPVEQAVDATFAAEEPPKN